MASCKGARIDTELKFAVESGESTIVKELLDKGANVHVDDEYCIKCAASYNYSKIAKLLIEAGADISNQMGNALMTVISQEYVATLEVFLECANISEELFEKALIYAAIYGKKESLLKLIESRDISKELLERILDISISLRDSQMAVLIVNHAKNVSETAAHAIEIARKYGANMKFMAPLFQLIK